MLARSGGILATVAPNNCACVHVRARVCMTRVSVLQCIAVHCSVLQCAAVCHSVFFVCMVRVSVLQCIAARCRLSQRVAVRCNVSRRVLWVHAPCLRDMTHTLT